MRTVADDILIRSGEGDTVQKAVKDDDKKLLTLLETCQEKGVKLNKEKLITVLRMTEIPYVGQVLTRDGLKPDPSKNRRHKKHEPTNRCERCTAACWSSELPDKILGKAGRHL